MFRGADAGFIDYWYTKKLVDCGSITNKNEICIDFELEDEDKDEDDKKLNNDHYQEQAICNNDNSSKNTKSIKSSFRNSGPNTKYTIRSMQTYQTNKNIRMYQRKETNTDNKLSTNINPSKYKGEMHSKRMLTISRLSEFKSRKREVLLDSFSKYRLK